MSVLKRRRLRQAGKGRDTDKASIPVHVDDEAAERAANDVIRTQKLPATASRRSHSCLKLVLLPPGLRIWEAIGQIATEVNTRLPDLLGRNDLMQINKIDYKDSGWGPAGLDIVCTVDEPTGVVLDG